MRLGKVNILLLTLLTLLSVSVSGAVNTQYDATVCGSGKYLFGCDALSSSGSVANTLGDSTVHLNLLMFENKATAYTATIEPGQKYLFGCQLLGTDGEAASNTLQQISCGCDSIVNFTLKVAAAPVPSNIHVAYTADIFEGESYLFGCMILKAAGPYSRTIDRVNGGDSIIDLTLNVHPVPTPGSDIHVAYTADIFEGEAYLFGCQILNAAGPYSRTIDRIAGGDSIINLTLNVHPVPAPGSDIHVAYTADIFEGETYLFGCQMLNAAGPYSRTIDRVAGGDSIIDLTLNVHPVPAPGSDIHVAYTADIFEGETYLFGCQMLNAAGPYSRTIDRVAGGDSIINLTLNVHPVPAPGSDIHVAYTADIFEGETYLFGCQMLNAAGPYSRTIDRVAGGDSIIDLTLNVHPVPAPGSDIHVAYTADIFEGETYLFGCQMLKAAGPYSHTIDRVAGGDSIIDLTLNVHPVPTPGSDIHVAYTADIFEGETYLFGCQILNAAGPYSRTIDRVAGGDSIIDLTLNVHPVPAAEPITVSYKAEINDGEKYLFGCQILEAEGDYQNTLKRTNGADSIVNLTLSFAQPAAEDIHVSYDAEIQVGDIYLFGCKTYQFSETGPQTLVNTLPRANGGDSIITVNLTVSAGGAASQDTAVAYEAIIKEGETYLFGCDLLKAEGTYSRTIDRIDVIGDSTIHLTLSFEKALMPENITVAYEATIVEGQIYLFGCDSLKAAGTYTNTLTRVAGGDSIINLTLKITPVPVVTYGDTTARDCGTFIWYEHTCVATGDFVHTFINGNSMGMDSIVTLHFTRLQPSNGDTTAVGCAGFKWYEHTCNASGNFEHTFVGGNIDGCDSIVTLHFTMLEPTYGDTVASGCAGYTWYEYLCLASDDYVHTFVGGNINGCDSIVTLHFTMLEATAGEESLEECDSIVWNGATYKESGDYTFNTTNVAGCDSVATLHLTIKKASYSIKDTTVCSFFEWHKDGGQAWEYSESGTYHDTLVNAAGCDSICTLNLNVLMPFIDTLDAVGFYGDRLLTINRFQINSIPGWYLDSIDNGQGYVKWYKMAGAAPDPTSDEQVATGYYYTLDGNPLPAGNYYATVEIPAQGGAQCDATGITEPYTISAAAAAPALMPSLARPGENIRVVNLNPMAETTIRIYSADGMLQKSYTASNADTYTIQAEYGNGFYLVEVLSDGMKSTLRYIVK